jgi:hypothetical protein
LRFSCRIILHISSYFLKNENKKADFNNKGKPKVDNDAHETMTTGGGEASATVTEDHHQEAGEPSDEIMESHNNPDGDN